VIYLCIKLELSLTSLQQSFSLLDVANSHTATPAMDHIDKVPAASSDSPHQFSLAIHAALAIGKKAMN
jgi:hypothetical protein